MTHTQRYVDNAKIRALAQVWTSPLYVPTYVPDSLPLSIAQETPFPNGRPGKAFCTIAFGQPPVLQITEDPVLQSYFSGKGAQTVTIFPRRHIVAATSPGTMSGEWFLQLRIPPVMVTMQGRPVSASELITVAKSLVVVPR